MEFQPKASKISLNGKLLPADGPVVHANNRALLYGDALFETIRLVGGKPQFLDDHIQRLQVGMKTLKMGAPDNFDSEFLALRMQELAQENGISGGARCRLTVMRNAGGRYTPITNEISYLLSCEPLAANNYELNEKGLNLGIYEEQRKPIAKLSSIKSTNSLLYVLAGIHKTEQGADRVLLLNELANVAEEISSNVFLVFNGVLYTPALTQGCLPGIMRKQVIKLAQAARIEVQEASLSPEVLFKADEVFLTNAIAGIEWVGAFKHKRYFNKMARRLNGMLNELAVSSAMDLPESSL